MADIGKLLRSIRKEWGLTLRQVKERSEAVAQLTGNASHVVSYSYLAKLECGKHDIQDMAVSKLLSLSEIYSTEPNIFLRECRLPRSSSQLKDPVGGPDQTRLIVEGRLADRAARFFPDAELPVALPAHTELLLANDPRSLIKKEQSARNRFRPAIVGESDMTLYPMVRPGAILTIDTYQRAIVSRKQYSNEFDRPIYLLDTRQGFVCAWCDLEEDDNMLRIVPHPLGHTHLGLLKYGLDVEVVGRVVFVAMSLEVWR